MWASENWKCAKTFVMHKLPKNVFYSYMANRYLLLPLLLSKSTNILVKVQTVSEACWCLAGANSLLKEQTCSGWFKIGPGNLRCLLLSSTFLLDVSSLYPSQRQGIRRIRNPDYDLGLAWWKKRANGCMLSTEPQPCSFTCVPAHISTQTNKCNKNFENRILHQATLNSVLSSDTDSYGQVMKENQVSIQVLYKGMNEEQAARKTPKTLEVQEGLLHTKQGGRLGFVHENSPTHLWCFLNGHRQERRYTWQWWDSRGDTTSFPLNSLPAVAHSTTI